MRDARNYSRHPAIFLSGYIMIFKRLILLSGVIFIMCQTTASENNISKRNELLQLLFREIDASLISKEYHVALLKKNESELIRILAEHYRKRPDSLYLQKKIQNKSFSAAVAERAVCNDVTVVNIPWKFQDKIDWIFNPTWQNGPVNNEWLWQLGRMYFWHDMLCCYQKTKDERFAKAFENQLRSWIFQADRKSALASQNSHNTWRTIEAGIRLFNTWSEAFEVFRKSPSVSDESICLMLASMYEQADFLRHNHRKQRNWMLMEMSGIYTFSSEFPEFKSSAKLRKYSAKVFSRAFCRQTLPDGMHNELSPDYHLVGITCAQVFIDQARLSDRMDELPGELLTVFEAGYKAYIQLATPALTAPRTNDCFTIKLPEIFCDALENFPENELFKWAASKRKEGKAPSDKPTASRFLPYAGFIAMRSGWDKDALYCCFDVGPLGEGHWHQDKLNINIYKGNEELIYDDGGGQYEQSLFRRYGCSSAGHNTVLVDGLVQKRNAPKTARKPIDAKFVSNEEFDYAKSSYNDTFCAPDFNGGSRVEVLTKPAVHTREIRFCKPDFFCVVDTLKSSDGKPHDYELRFQLNTSKTCKTDIYPQAVLSDFDGNKYDILILPLCTEQLEISTATGRTSPYMAGWFIGRNDMARRRATTVMMTAKQQKNFTFATLLIPISKGGDLPQIKKLNEKQFSVTVNGKNYEINLAELNKH